MFGCRIIVFDRFHLYHDGYMLRDVIMFKTVEDFNKNLDAPYHRGLGLIII